MHNPKTMAMKINYLFKSFFYILPFILVGGVYSCSSDEEDDGMIVCPIEEYGIKLKQSKSFILPFEDIKLSIDVDSEILKNNYDSIRWVANGAAAFAFGRSPWWNEDDDMRDLRITDCIIGKHKAYALGYRNGVVISKDSVEYEVTKPYADFISISWSEKGVNQYFYFTTGRTPANYLPIQNEKEIIMGVTLSLNHIVEKKDIQYAKLQFTPWVTELLAVKTKSVDLHDFINIDWLDDSYEGRRIRCNTEYAFFCEYLRDLYGVSQFIYEGEDVAQTTLIDEYKKRFSYIYPSDCYPVEIWETPSSYISILCYNDKRETQSERGPSFVIAQPRRK